MIRETGEFVINLTTEELAFATDYCGVKSGRDVDKFKETGLTREKAEKVKAPMIAEAPVSVSYTHLVVRRNPISKNKSAKIISEEKNAEIRKPDPDRKTVFKEEPAGQKDVYKRQEEES